MNSAIGEPLEAVTSSPDLLVLTPRVGDTSETFITSHLRNIAPGRTHAVTRQIVNPCSGLPVTVVDQRRGRKRWRDRAASLAPIVRRFRRSDWAPSESAWAAFDSLIGERPAAVLVEYLDQFTQFAERAAERGVPVVLHAHGYDVSSRLRDPYWRQRYAELSNTDGVRIVAVSNFIRDRLVEADVNESAIHVVPCAVEDLLADRGGQADLASNHVVGLAVGRLVAKKDLTPVLHALAAVGNDVDLHLRVVGDGPLRRPLEQTVKRLGLEEHVHFLGALPHGRTLDEIAACDFLVQSSSTDLKTGDTEGLPVAVLEAMSLAKPVLSTLHAGIPEAVADGTSGILVAERDVEGFTGALRALSDDPDLRNQMGEAGRSIWAARFTQDKQLSALRALLGLKA